MSSLDPCRSIPSPMRRPVRRAFATMLTTLAVVYAAAAAEAAVICVPSIAIDGSCTAAAASINAAIAAANAGGGDTVLVDDGAYVENVVIDRDLVLKSVNGRAVTSIGPLATPSAALGTIKVNTGSTAVQIGDVGQGFTISGIDNSSPGIESAAIYFQGSHSDAAVLDNEIVAAGDGALLTEFGGTNSGFIVDGNEFSGQSFAGANPAGNGFGMQFTLANVPRQLVTISGGSGGGSHSDITFTNNTISGAAGGCNGAGEEQGNTLVTIDADGATITGNVFAGTTTRFATSVRARGPSTTISGNDFDSTGLTSSGCATPILPPATGHVFLQSTGEDVATVAGANTYDKGVYVAGAIGTIGLTVEGFVELVGTSFPSGTTVNVLAGTYQEGRPQIVASADVSVVGAGKTATFIEALADTTSSGNGRGWWLANPGVSFSISDLTLDGAGFKIWQGIRHIGSGGSVENVQFTDMAFQAPGAGSPYAGTGIAIFGTGPVDVTDSMFAGSGRIGIHYFGSAVSGSTASGNMFVGKGAGNHLDYAYDISNGAVVSVTGNTISGNRGVAATDGSTSAGILVSTFFGAGTGATIDGNLIFDNTTGIFRGFDSSDTSAMTATCNRIVDNDNGIVVVGSSAASVAASMNTIAGNLEGIDTGSLSGGPVDAEDNWWGAADGPSGAGPGSGDSITADVDADPFATSVPACVSCTADAECDDGLACTGLETCNLGTSMCEAGTSVDCSGNDCLTGACLEPAGTCVPEPSGAACDSGLDVCTEDDTCDGAGGCDNTGGGGDVDTDGVCDLDDLSDGPEMNVTRTTLKTQKGTNANGSIRVKGDFIADPQASFTGSPVYSLTVSDDLGFVHSHTWAPGECETNSKGRVKCKSADKRFKGTFKPFRKTPTVFKYSVSFRKLAIPEAMAFAAPITVRLSFGPTPPPEGSLDRTGIIVDCKAVSRGLRCRE